MSQSLYALYEFQGQVHVLVSHFGRWNANPACKVQKSNFSCTRNIKTTDLFASLCVRFTSADPRLNIDGGVVLLLFNSCSKMYHILFTAFCVPSQGCLSVDRNGCSTCEVTLVCIELNKQ